MKGVSFMGMETRKIVNLKASIVSNNKRHPGIIENLTKNTLYLRAATINPSSDFTPGKSFEIHFQSTSGRGISLPGKVLWSYDTPPHGLTKSIGMEIEEENPEYKKLLDEL